MSIMHYFVLRKRNQSVILQPENCREYFLLLFDNLTYCRLFSNQLLIITYDRLRGMVFPMSYFEIHSEIALMAGIVCVIWAYFYTIITLISLCRCSETAGRNSCSIVSGDVYNCSYRLTVLPVTSSRLSSA